MDERQKILQFIIIYIYIYVDNFELKNKTSQFSFKIVQTDKIAFPKVQ